MNDDWTAEDELSIAMDEIRKNEKDMNMIAMVAQTFVEKMNELQDQVNDQAIQITQKSAQESETIEKLQALNDETTELRNRCEKQEAVRDDMQQRINTVTERKNKAEKKN